MTDSANVVREQLEADVLIVGAGPGGLACALHLANLIEKHTAAKKSPALSAENIYVLEKGREIGAHQLSGAIMDPRGLARARPRLRKIRAARYARHRRRRLLLHANPAPTNCRSRRRRCAITATTSISLNKLVKWLGGLVEKKGVNLFTQFAGANCSIEKNGIAGVLTEDKGVDKNGKPKDNFTPGYELRAKVTVLAEGPRGSLTKDLVNRFQARWTESASLRHRHQRTVGSAAGTNRNRLRGAHAWLAARFRHVRRRLDLRLAAESRFARAW